MALFKVEMAKYEISHYCQDNYLALHCSRYDYIKAPFDGELIIDKGEYILKKDNFKLYISNIDIITKGEVKAGDFIGTPKLCKDGRAYFYVKLYKYDDLEDILIYLKRKDKTIDKIAEYKPMIIIEVDRPEKPAKKETTAKKKTSSKKKSSK